MGQPVEALSGVVVRGETGGGGKAGGSSGFSWGGTDGACEVVSNEGSLDANEEGQESEADGGADWGWRAGGSG